MATGYPTSIGAKVCAPSTAVLLGRRSHNSGPHVVPHSRGCAPPWTASDPQWGTGRAHPLTKRTRIRWTLTRKWVVFIGL